MNLVGSPADWAGLIESLVPDILNLVISTWEEMPASSVHPREDPTTEEFSRWLRRSRDGNTLPFQVHVQMVELAPGAGEDQGRMDIVFVPLIPREDIYFCLECKRLNVVYDDGVRTYASEYLTHGMLRFIHGQYAAQVRNGGMLGYVLDGNVAHAIQNVSRLIEQRHEELQMQAPGEMDQSSILPHDPRLRETRHFRLFKAENFLIHHIFAKCGN